MSPVAEPRPQPQNHPDRLDPPQAPAAQTAPRAPTEEDIAAAAAPAALDHAQAHARQDDQYVLAHATAQQSLQLDSEQHRHPHHSQLHHHADGGPTQAPAHDLEAANIAHFDALGHDFDKQHPFAAEFADRLARALLRRRPPSSSSQTLTLTQSSSASGSGSGSGSGGGGSSSLVLDEDATSVLDYACGSGM